MATLNKISNGLLFSDTFSSILPIWSCFPSGERFKIENSFLKINHGIGEAEFLLGSPEIFNYNIQVELDYTPSVSGSGGFVMKSITGNDVSVIVDSYDTRYPKFIRLHYDDFYVVTASCSYDGISFEDLGSTRCDDLNELGFFLNDELNDMYVKSIYIYKNDFIKISNVDSSLNFKIKKDDIESV